MRVLGRPRAALRELTPLERGWHRVDEFQRGVDAVELGRRAQMYGGVGYETQIRELRRGVDVLVACPGRLIDLVERRAVELDGIEIVVIDEADRRHGFLPQMRKLLDLVSSKRQTMLFSATLDGDIGALVREYQNDPVRHEVGEIEPDLDASTHAFLHIEATERPRHTATLINKHGSTIVFCRTRHGADRLVKQLSAAGIGGFDPRWSFAGSARSRAGVVEAGRCRRAGRDRCRRARHPRRRCRACRPLRSRRRRQGYLHRSGRTGRAGATGVVVTLVSDALVRDVRRLQRDVGLVGALERVGRAPALPAKPERPGKPEAADGGCAA